MPFFNLKMPQLAFHIRIPTFDPFTTTSFRLTPLRLCTITSGTFQFIRSCGVSQVKLFSRLLPAFERITHIHKVFSRPLFVCYFPPPCQRPFLHVPPNPTFFLCQLPNQGPPSPRSCQIFHSPPFPLSNPRFSP